MKLPRNIDADVLSAHLIRNWGYFYVRQTGSHARLRTESPSQHSITIPMHNPIKPGTFSGIVKEISEHKRVTVAELLKDL